MSDATLYGDGEPREATQDEIADLFGDDIARLWADNQDDEP